MWGFMKIVYHHRTSAQDGSAVHIDSLIDALRAQGVEVQLVAPVVASRPAARAGSGNAGGWVKRLRRRLPPALYELAELAFNLPETFRLWLTVRRHRPDLIYERSNLYLLSGSIVARLARKPLISEVNAPYCRERYKHDGLALPALARWTECFAWRSADAVVTVTQVMADLVVEGGAPRERLHVMPNGIDPRLFSRHAIDTGAKARLGLAEKTVLGFTGYVREWNGLEAVIRFLAGAHSEALFLLIVGDGPARPQLEHLARELGVQDRLRFTGVVQREVVPGFVSAFDIALQPAANPYASPLKLFEYMALGRAIVAPDQPNIREVLQDGRNAALFAPDEPGSFVRAIARICSDSELRDRIATGAQQTVEQRQLTWQRNAARVIGLAEALLGRSEAAPTRQV
jgi:glycosyltransferase involved in cell wall biosynthesis